MEQETNLLLKQWLLDIAIEFPRPLVMLFPTVQGAALNVKEIPSQRAENYFNAFLGMFEEDLIRFNSDFPGDDLRTATGVATVLSRFQGLSEDDPRICRGGRLLRVSERLRSKELSVSFELTPAGGQAWERLAEPNWDRCLTESVGESDCELVSQNLDLLMVALGWFREMEGGRVDWDSVEIEKQGDFPIYYWKHLPYAFRAKFAFKKAEGSWSGSGPNRSREPRWFREWWDSATSWYRKPWELSVWPRSSNNV